jgi:peptide/nickel transport system substrate-binding protein
MEEDFMSAPEPGAATGGAAAPLPPAPTRRPWTLVVIVVVVIVALAGVTAYYFWPRAASDTVVYATSSEMVTLDPSTEFSNSILVLPNVYETLTLWNPGTNTAEPLLATGWTHTSDGMSWTFNLRHGVTFHDGTPFNATAVKYSLLRTMTMNAGAAYIWFPIAEPDQNITILDEYTVRIDTMFPAAVDKIASSGYAAYIFSPNTPGATYEEQQTWFNDGHHDSGSGPYMINSASYNNTSVVLDRFPGYWGGWSAGQFQHAIIKTIADPAQREAAVVSGDTDVTMDVPVQDLPTLQTNSKVSVVENPSYRALYAFFNSARGPTANQSFRQALAYAIPYGDIVSTVVSGLGLQSIGVIPATMWGHDDTLPHYTYDLAKAQQLLDESGVATPLTLKFTYLVGDLFEQKFGELYKEKLATLGITLDVVAMPWEQQWALAQTPLATGSQDIFVMYWWPTYVTPYDFLFNMFHSASYAFFNLGYYNNSVFDGTIDAANALEATDPSEALVGYRASQVMLNDDCPGLGVVDLKNLYLLKADLNGFVDNPAYPLVVFFYQLSR